MTSMSTIRNPTEPERQWKNTINGAMDKVSEALTRAVSTDKTSTAEKWELPQTTVMIVESAVSGKKTWDQVLKSPYAFPMKDKKVDMTKPERMYMKLMFSGQGDKLNVKTKMYAPRCKEPLNYLNVVNVRGFHTPVVMWDDVYYGSHGPESTICASLRFKVYETEFEPSSFGFDVGRMMPSEEEEEDDSVDVGRIGGSSATTYANNASPVSAKPQVQQIEYSNEPLPDDQGISQVAKPQPPMPGLATRKVVARRVPLPNQ